MAFVQTELSVRILKCCIKLRKPFVHCKLYIVNCTFLYIEQEMHNVAVLHEVVFSFDA